MPKFTPGPWELVYDRITGNYYIGGDFPRQLTTVSMPCGGCGISMAELQANARLISSAPSLYSAARDALEMLRNMTTDEFANGADQPIRKQLAAALTLADGEERIL